ncbi:MAG: hypothetical protein HYZ42_01780, partial [Bacteroidetes bacterium]|nr:hypothetical protein [Bacteroidota bacterium]
NRPVILVVSAFYGITNALIACVQAAKEGAGTKAALAESQDYTKTLRALKREILEANISDPSQRARIEQALGVRIDQLDRYLTGIHCIGDVPTFVNDAILSYGERLSSLPLSGLSKLLLSLDPPLSLSSLLVYERFSNPAGFVPFLLSLEVSEVLDLPLLPPLLFLLVNGLDIFV